MQIETIITQVLGAAGVAVMGLFTFLVKSYFARGDERHGELKSAFDKLDGKLEALQKDVRDNTLAMAVKSQELRAIWRYVDAAPRRASDIQNGKDDE